MVWLLLLLPRLSLSGLIMMVECKSRILIGTGDTECLSVGRHGNRGDVEQVMRQNGT